MRRRCVGAGDEERGHVHGGHPLRIESVGSQCTHLTRLRLDASHELIESVERYCADAIGEQRSAGVGDEILEAAIAYPVFFRVPADHETEFNAWYDDEHLGILLRGEYWRMCRRFRIRNPDPASWTHIALHYLTDLRALESPERTEARSTPWRIRLAAEPWFKGEYRVYHRHGERLSESGGTHQATG